MNYKQSAKDIRDAMRPIRISAGEWLMSDMKKAWGRNETKYVIPPGTYAITGPIPIPTGANVEMRPWLEVYLDQEYLTQLSR